MTPLGRGATFGLGAALSAIGFTLGCSSDAAPAPEYGAACAPYFDCGGKPMGGSAGVGGVGGGAGTGTAGEGGSAGVDVPAQGAAGEGGEAGTGGGG